MPTTTGVIRIATRTDGVSTTLFHRASADAPFEAFKTVSFKDEFSPLFFTFDNKNLFRLHQPGRAR